MLEPLTKRQEEILEFIKKYNKEKGYSPTLEEIKISFRLNSLSTVHEHLENLKKKGYIKKTMNQSRGIQSYDINSYFYEIPILGSYSKQKGIAEFTTHKTVLIHKDNLDDKDTHYFGLIVEDKSLGEEHFFEHDLLVFEKDSKAEDDDIVLVKIGSSTIPVIKKFSMEGTRIKIESLENKDNVRYYKKANILGKLKQLIRFYPHKDL